MANNKKPIKRYELNVDGVRCYLAPLTFHVAEAALGFTFLQFPKPIAAGEILINSLFIEGSPKFKNKKDMFWNKACVQASKALAGLFYAIEDDPKEKGVSVVTLELEGKEYKFRIGGEPDRDSLEDALGLVSPNYGQPRPLTAGKKILDACWIDGDEEVRTNDELLIIACLVGYRMIESANASLTKLSVSSK